MTRSELLAVIEEAKRSGQTSLNLRRKYIQEIPIEIGQLDSLIFLDISGNQLTFLPDSMSNLVNLTSLNLSHNKLEKIPEVVFQLQNLNSLTIGGNQLSEVSEAISKLDNLTFLDLSDNLLRLLPESIGEVLKLEILDLRFNKLTKLPACIGQLLHLSTLDLGSNQIVDLPDSLCNLHRLSYIDCWNNKLAKLPNSFGQIISLSYLGLENNQLTELPESFGQLSHLQNLNLESNRISKLPESFGQLSHLQNLNLRDNKISDFPDSLVEIENLTYLNLNYNRLQSLPESIGCLTKIQAFTVYGNPLNELTQEIFAEEGAEILNYYRQLLKDKEYIYEAKLLILGEGGAGKTSLANKLIDFEYPLKLEGGKTPEKSTEGIDVFHFDFLHSSGNSFRINLWDFGGQEIYHATHQFFLTKQSLYLLVVDTRQDNTDFNYWLEVVELLTEASPTLIIKNEKQDRLCQINENQLRERFPNLEKILPTNLSTNRGLSEILSTVQHHICQLPHIGRPLPKNWIKVRKALETETRNYISQDEFLQICDTNELKDREEKFLLSDNLHILGVCLHFQEDPILKNYIILKPEWGTAAVYKVLDTPKVQKNHGHFTHRDLAEIWSDDQYTDMRDELLQLMMKFKLCYEIPRRPGTYIAPQLLSLSLPTYPWNDSDNLILRYHYDFMPKGMLTHFIVEMHKLIDGELVWKDGVILKDDNAQAEIIEARHNNEINIRISGKIKKSLLEKVRYEFSKIHDSYKRLKYQEYIPCNCTTCKGAQTPFSYSLNRLQERLKNDRYEIECDISYQMISVRGLIDDSVGSAARRQDDDRPSGIPDRQPEVTPSPSVQVTVINTQNQDKAMSDVTNNLQGANIGNFANEVKDSARQQNIQHIHQTQNQNLAQAAQEIKALLDQLAKDNPVEGDFVRAGRAIEAIKNNPTLKQRLGNAIKESGTTAVEKAIETITQNPAAGVIIAGVKGFIDA